jgi:hypothetical protein
MNQTGDTILTITYPTEKVKKILDDLKLEGDANDLRGLPFEQKKLLILVAFREFLKGRLFLEELSEIANSIKMYFPAENKTEEQEDYELMIYEAADMSIYLRAYEPNSGNTFGGYMDTMWGYFNKYKNLLKNLPKKYLTPSPIEK